MNFKNSSALKITTAVIVSLGIGVAGTYYLANNAHTKQVNVLQDEITILQQTIRQDVHSSFIAIDTINKGDIITEDMITFSEVSYSGNPLSLTLNGDDIIGSIARVDMQDGDIISNTMYSKFDPKGIKEKEVSFIRMNSNLSGKDMVDVRVSYNNGEDYIVLAKKSLKELNLIENNAFLWLNEFELLNLSSATIDASLHEGAFLYVTRYIDTDLQDPAIANYQPNGDVIDLIRSNPNIVQEAERKLSKEIRQGLESRLKTFTEDNGLVTSVDVRNDNIFNTIANEAVSQNDIEGGLVEDAHPSDYVPEGQATPITNEVPEIEIEVTGEPTN